MLCLRASEFNVTRNLVHLVTEDETKFSNEVLVTLIVQSGTSTWRVHY